MAGILVSAVQLGCNPYVGAPYVLNLVAAVVVGARLSPGGVSFGIPLSGHDRA